MGGATASLHESRGFYTSHGPCMHQSQDIPTASTTIHEARMTMGRRPGGPAAAMLSCHLPCHPPASPPVSPSRRAHPLTRTPGSTLATRMHRTRRPPRHTVRHNGPLDHYVAQARPRENNWPPRPHAKPPPRLAVSRSRTGSGPVCRSPHPRRGPALTLRPAGTVALREIRPYATSRPHATRRDPT